MKKTAQEIGEHINRSNIVEIDGQRYMQMEPDSYYIVTEVFGSSSNPVDESDPQEGTSVLTFTVGPDDEYQEDHLAFAATLVVRALYGGLGDSKMLKDAEIESVVDPGWDEINDQLEGLGD